MYKFILLLFVFVFFFILGTFDYLNDEENKVQRILFIACGGLFGLVLARKGTKKICTFTFE